MNTNAYILVVIGILFAKCFGFLRDIVFASNFGASEFTDIYFQIFSLASLFFTGIGSALSTLVISRPDFNAVTCVNFGTVTNIGAVADYDRRSAVCTICTDFTMTMKKNTVTDTDITIILPYTDSFFDSKK